MRMNMVTLLSKEVTLKNIVKFFSTETVVKQYHL